MSSNISDITPTAFAAMTPAQRKRKQRARDAADPQRKHRRLDTLFMFGCVEVAVILDAEGRVWFKGVDIARALEMEDPNNAISLYVNKKYTQSYEKLICSNSQYRDILGVHPHTTFVNEMGMNLFVLRSRKPKAEAFAEWVCGQVLPSIRKTGKYEITDPNNNPYKELTEFLKMELKTKNVQLTSALETVAKVNQQLLTLRPTCIAPVANKLKDEYVVIYRKYDATLEETIEEPELLHFPYYGCRVQSSLLKAKESELRREYPTMKMLAKFPLPNSVNFFNYIFEEMANVLTRGKGKFVQSFRLTRSDGVTEATMMSMINNLYRTLYGENV